MSELLARWVLECSTTRGPARRVLMALAELADDTGSAPASYAEIARRTGLTAYRVKQAVERLERHRAISVMWSNGRRPVYAIRMEADAPARLGGIVEEGVLIVRTFRLFCPWCGSPIVGRDGLTVFTAETLPMFGDCFDCRRRFDVPEPEGIEFDDPFRE